MRAGRSGFAGRVRSVSTTEVPHPEQVILLLSENCEALLSESISLSPLLPGGMTNMHVKPPEGHCQNLPLC